MTFLFLKKYPGKQTGNPGKGYYPLGAGEKTWIKSMAAHRPCRRLGRAISKNRVEKAGKKFQILFLDFLQ
jgi:hypothetical protein